MTDCKSCTELRGRLAKQASEYCNGQESLWQKVQRLEAEIKAMKESQYNGS